MKSFKEKLMEKNIVEKFKLDINKMSDKKVLQKIADDIFSADEGYGKYSAKEINKELYRIGIADKDGAFLTNLKGKKAKIADALSDLIG